MISVTDVLKDLLSSNPFLQFGLAKRLFNLTRLSKELRPQVEVRAKKEITESAVLMSLSRIQRTLQKITGGQVEIPVENLTIQTNISTYTFPKTKEVNAGVHRLLTMLQNTGSFVTICEGMQEITILLDTAEEARVSRCFSERPINHQSSLAALSLIFNEKDYLATPGVICFVLQQLLLQGINLVEVSSTYTGLTLYVEERDAKIAFETLYRLFPVKRS